VQNPDQLPRAAGQRLERQIQFVLAIDQLKQVLRQTLLTDGSRRENSAEHSWHLAMMALVLAEYAPLGTNLLRAIQMVLLHDLVEIHAGDTFCFDAGGQLDKTERETAAANQLYSQLPDPQGVELLAIWEEFEAGATATAQFAIALDRLQPLLHNWQTEGGTWKQHDIERERVLKRMAPIAVGTPQLWPLVERILDDCVAAGYLKDNE
jgi:putative hydrolase of HD superfamily